MFLAAAMLLTLGLLLPAFHVQSFWIFTRDISILFGISELSRNDQPYLAWFLLFVSVLVPLAKSLLGLYIVMNVRMPGLLLAGLIGTFELLGKLSFVDVFVIALIVIVLDGRVLTVASLGPGIYAYADGVALSWIATAALASMARQARA